ncbi:DUF2793 domain-containing protein [Paremcibacter congregatus]|uniref:DUF2793 domain-containing protein n=1 Tax=Paremcibacter congregatus TaxID=2043170 RepID=UPI0030EC58AB
MTDQTPRLQMPYIIASQAQKEVSHNQALNQLDALVQPVVETADLSEPPLTPMAGGLWLVASGASGDWAGNEDHVAQYMGGGWLFYAPFEGMCVGVKDQNITARYVAGLWRKGQVTGLSFEISGQQVVGPQQGAVSDPVGGAIIDTEARLALTELLAALRYHGLIAAL